MEIYHGDIVYAEEKHQLKVCEDSYIVVQNGVVEGICSSLPEKYSHIKVIDYKRGLIIPAFSDLHIHASQYVQRGIGMDALLSDWLNQYTFPQEAKFADINYAKNTYDSFVEDLIRHGTFHTSIFTTIHRKATDYLFSKMEERGLYGFVGKVNMDRNSPEYLCETTKESLQETEIYLHEHSTCTTVKPIITPRFAPTCSKELIDGLGVLARKYHCSMQTHLVESRWEAQESLRLFPGYHSDAEIYERAGLMDNGISIYAHFIFPTAEDIRILKNHNCITVHCPDATTNVIAGIMPAAALQAQDINISIGSDIGGGHSIAIYRQISRAVQLSKLKEFYEPEGNQAITFSNAFYMATKAGGSVFGKVGSFEKGYLFNALVIDHIEDNKIKLSPEKRLERFCYIGDDRNIIARYLSGSFID